MSIKKELISGVFYASIAKYTGILVTLVVSGVLARLFTPEQFGVVGIATVIITFFAVFSDLGIAPAVIQHKNLDERDLGNIFSLTVWSGITLAVLFFLSAPLIARFYNDSESLPTLCRILSVNLLFAAINIVPNALIMKAKRFRFAAVRSLSVQIAGGAAAIIAALSGVGIYALLINPIFSSIAIFVVNFREHPLALNLHLRWESIRKVFSFSAYQFGFQLINYFSRNLDKLLIPKALGMSALGYYDKSYRLMMLPLQNIAYVISPVMHPIFSEFQHDLQKLAESYLKVIRFLAFIGLPLSVVLCFTSRELILIIFGGQWQASVAVLQILSLSVGIQIIMSTSGAIFQAANATRMLFICGLFSATLNVTSICVGIFVFRNLEVLAWCICASFLINFLQCYHAMFPLTLHTSMKPFWQTLGKPALLAVIISLPLAALQFLLPTETNLLLSLAIKGITALIIWFAFIQLSGEYDIRGLFIRKLLKRDA